jgi:hypothetical protein
MHCASMVKTPSKQDWYTYLGEKKAQGLKSPDLCWLITARLKVGP